MFLDFLFCLPVLSAAEDSSDELEFFRFRKPFEEDAIPPRPFRPPRNEKALNLPRLAGETLEPCGLISVLKVLKIRLRIRPRAVYFQVHFFWFYPDFFITEFIQNLFIQIFCRIYSFRIFSESTYSFRIFFRIHSIFFSEIIQSLFRVYSECIQN